MIYAAEYRGGKNNHHQKLRKPQKTKKSFKILARQNLDKLNKQTKKAWIGQLEKLTPDLG